MRQRHDDDRPVMVVAGGVWALADGGDQLRRGRGRAAMDQALIPRGPTVWAAFAACLHGWSLLRCPVGPLLKEWARSVPCTERPDVAGAEHLGRGVVEPSPAEGNHPTWNFLDAPLAPVPAKHLAMVEQPGIIGRTRAESYGRLGGRQVVRRHRNLAPRTTRPVFHGELPERLPGCPSVVRGVWHEGTDPDASVRPEGLAAAPARRGSGAGGHHGSGAGRRHGGDQQPATPAAVAARRAKRGNRHAAWVPGAPCLYDTPP